MMNQKLRKAMCPNWCPKKFTDCDFECYEWEEKNNNKNNQHLDTAIDIKNNL